MSRGSIRKSDSSKKDRSLPSFGVPLRIACATAILGLTLSLVADTPPAFATGTTVTFSYTGSVQTWTVPSGVTSLQVTLDGAQGSSAYGGFGGQVQGIISVTPATVLNIYVGGQGSGTTGGFNGGGGGNFNHPSGAAGGGSDIRIGGTALSNRVMVAGGGGGSGASNDDGAILGLGGAGGGLVGEAGGSDGASEGGGAGGSQSGGGAAGTGGWDAAGSLGQGAGGAANGGDGGGGYYGGGSGGTNGSGSAAGGGGGGSSYAEGSATGVSYIQGYQAGNGLTTITYPPSPTSTTPSPGSQNFTYTGAPQLWTVPAGVTSINVAADGAKGQGAYGGYGAAASAVVPVIPGESVAVMVGGQGSGTTGGFDGGGGGNFNDSVGAGGGASDVRIGGIGLADRAIVAAGGGGGGQSNDDGAIFGQGGSGGAPAGEAGGNDGSVDGGGSGATQTGGGAAGSGGYSAAGVLGQGAGGAANGGDGGGGYYGGGSGGTNGSGSAAGGGGGGSSFAEASATSVTYIKGYESGNGQVLISWASGPSAPSTPTSATSSFSYTGAPQLWTVPAGVNEIGVVAAGGQGDSTTAAGGLGGATQAVVSVTPGSVIMVMVGGQGSVTTGGFDGGGGGNFNAHQGAGGGASDVRVGGVTLADRAVIAGGGGGGGLVTGGGGGGLIGVAGTNDTSAAGGGGGGSQTSGGAAGAGGWSAAGVLGQGAGGAANGGDGGGGYYGGGSGGVNNPVSHAGGGGGGSSYAEPGATQMATATGVNSGNGSVTIYTGSHISTNASLGAFELLAGDNPSEPGVALCQACRGLPVDTQSGNFFHSFSELTIPGRGPSLNLGLTYNSALASTNGPFGYGWSSTYTMSLTSSSGVVTVDQENGSEITFTQVSGAGYVAAPRVQATLVNNPGGTWTLTRQNGDSFTFNSSGQLTAETDRNGYTTSLAYSSGELSTVTDPAGRYFTFGYTGSLITSVTDSTSREVQFQYTDGHGNLNEIIDARGGDTSLTYDSSHRMLTMLDPNQHGSSSPHPVTNVYDSSSRVTSQTDQMGLVTLFDYTTVPGSTIITDPHGSKTLDTYTNGQLTEETRAYGTSQAVSTTYTYDPVTFLRTSVDDPNSQVTLFDYDAQGSLTSTTDADGNVTQSTYNAFGEPLTVTSPKGLVTSYTYDANGNVLAKIVTGIGGSPTETTTYFYSDGNAGDLTEIEDPDGHFTTYTYDSYGNRTSSTTYPDTGTLTSATGSADHFTYGTSAPTISAVGTLANASGTGTTTLSVSPQHTGDIMVLATKVASSSISTSSVSGGGVTTWTRVEGPYTGYTGNDLEIWTGTVTTTGASTITVTFSGSVSSIWTGLASQEILVVGGIVHDMGRRQERRHQQRLVHDGHLPDADTHRIRRALLRLRCSRQYRILGQHLGLHLRHDLGR